METAERAGDGFENALIREGNFFAGAEMRNNGVIAARQIASVRGCSPYSGFFWGGAAFKDFPLDFPLEKSVTRASFALEFRRTSNTPKN